MRIESSSQCPTDHPHNRAEELAFGAGTVAIGSPAGLRGVSTPASTDPANAPKVTGYEGITVSQLKQEISMIHNRLRSAQRQYALALREMKRRNRRRERA